VESQRKYQFGPFLIDFRERLLQRDGQPVAVTPKAFNVLAALVEQPGRLLSKDELLHTVWPDTFVEESNLAYNVFALRKALGDAAESGLYIETVPKRGYRFTAAVTPVGSEPAAPPVPTPAKRGSEPFAGEARPPSPTKVEDTVADGAVPRRAPAGAFRRIWPLAAATALVLALTLYLPAWSGRAWRNAEPRPVLLTSLAGVVSSPSLSPDGRYVVFTWTGPKQDNRDLYVQQIGAGSPLRLTTDPAEDLSASWSPDGRAIAFLRAEPQGQKKEVRLIAPLGGVERKVGAIQPRMQFAGLTVEWCPNSTCVLVTDSPGGKSDALFAIAIDSGEKRQVTFPPELVSDVDPAVSPDGRSLIFRRNTTSFRGSFYRVALSDGAVPSGEPVRLTPPLGEGASTWTRDGREIVFSANRVLWRFDAIKGGTPARLASVGQDGQSPVIAPTDDGRQRLVYLHSVADVNVWRVTLSEPGAPASAQPVAAIASTRGDFNPAVSPDGRRMAFVSDRSGDWQVWVADADGSGASKLTSMGFRSIPGSLSWSPDGASIAFMGDPEGRGDVFVVPASGGRPRILSAKLSYAAFPRFSRDGRWIYFCSAERQVWKMPATGGDAVKVTNGPAGRPIESADGHDLYYGDAQDRADALWRLSLAGGAPVKVLDGVINYHFAVNERGIYYLERVSDSRLTSKPVLPAGPGGQTRLQYFDFATGRSTTVARDLGLVGFAGLSASPDGRHVFFGRADSFVDELMVVDDFR
jgi:eukaryotic-like serine/threonine-protein kinase